MSELFSHNLDADAAAQDQAKLGSRWYLWVYAQVIVGLLVPLLLVALFNLANDRYGVFRNDRTFVLESNLDIFRLKYLLQNDDEQRLVLLGTSRASALDLQGRLSDSAYTFPIDGGGIYYYSLTLRNLVANGVIPETVILGLGEAVINAPAPAQRQRLYLDPQIEELTLFDFLRNYLLFVPAKRDFIIFRNRVRGYLNGIDQERAREIIQTGRTYCIECDARVMARADREHAALLDESARRWALSPTRNEVGEEGVAYTLETIGDIKQLAETHGFRLFIYMDPQYREFYLHKYEPSLLQFKRELTAIQPFLDFGNFDAAFNNPRSFLDPMHYNEDLGAKITDDIAAAMRGDLDQLKLGTWVTPENAASYTRQLEAEYRRLKESE